MEDVLLILFTLVLYLLLLLIMVLTELLSVMANMAKVEEEVWLECPSFFGPCLTQCKLLKLRERERVTIHSIVDLSITILSTKFQCYI